MRASAQIAQSRRRERTPVLADERDRRLGQRIPLRLAKILPRRPASTSRPSRLGSHERASLAVKLTSWRFLPTMRSPAPRLSGPLIGPLQGVHACKRGMRRRARVMHAHAG